ncbi:SDR family NAD(P)-dependent oxidoreductase [Streptomyces sp. NPDC096311]|uniref:SDR family NAD(P)-dependent oxidoreductase n=1 Tax=Streptomyces sp. NPDC096311 TaxID=3366083 RepID=UPI003801CE7B
MASEPEGAKRVAVVTGGAAGIGQGSALRLARDGHIVIVADLGPADETEKLIREADGEVFSARCDVADADSVAQFAAAVTDRFGHVDILVHSAGIYPMASFAQTDWATWRRIMDVNLDSLFHLTKAFLPGMERHGWGRIAVMAAATSHVGPPGMVAYAVSKSGLNGFVSTLAAEVGEHGITVNAIAPGLIRTPGTLSGPQQELGLFGAMVTSQAIKRTGVPDDLAGTVSFLTSDEAAFMTGQTLVVDGGFARA